MVSSPFISTIGLAFGVPIAGYLLFVFCRVSLRRLQYYWNRLRHSIFGTNVETPPPRQPSWVRYSSHPELHFRNSNYGFPISHPRQYSASFYPGFINPPSHHYNVSPSHFPARARDVARYGRTRRADDRRRNIVLPSFKMDDHRADETCGICLDEFGESDVTAGECSHIFHTSCLSSWLAKEISHRLCPLCRMPYKTTTPHTTILVWWFLRSFRFFPNMILIFFLPIDHKSARS